MNEKYNSFKTMDSGYTIIEAMMGILLVGAIIFAGLSILQSTFSLSRERKSYALLKSIDESNFRRSLETDCRSGEYKMAFNGKLQTNGKPFRETKIQAMSNGELPNIQKTQDLPGESSSSLLITRFTGEVVSYYEAVSQETSKGILYTITRYGPEVEKTLKATNLLKFCNKQKHLIENPGQDIIRFEFDEDSSNLHLFIPDSESSGETLTFGKELKSKKAI